MVNDNIHIISVAAGSGTRFGSETPKQFLPLDGKPVVMHAIDTFRQAFPGGKILLVLSGQTAGIWQGICRSMDYNSPDTVLGGATRTESVRHALDHIRKSGSVSDSDIIMIHDGARPLVTAALAKKIASALDGSSYAGAVPGYMPSDSIMRQTPECGQPADRSEFRLVQTPQAFRAGVLIKAYDSMGDMVMSDDASVLSNFSSEKTTIVDGDRENIKITHPGDIQLAEFYIHRRKR
ncbi:MAG: 2-C-methyl-D-erythritol 4-phosphate cytidylyltransferase [Muribaculaceae bacterium]|nr:2-C-methyl-D-erythritol 4-phosphate cytidylyltransferase [Muribaculaceae bacterium]